MADWERRKYEKLLDDLSSIKGRHTELVTVYIPAGSNLNKVVDQLRNEQSTAQNIKSKQVRKSVLAALEKILQHLKEYRKTPEHGLAIFCGNISEKEGITAIEIFVVEPPEELRVRIYQCDQRFNIEPLRETFEEKEVFGLIVLDKSEATIGILKGKRVEVLKNMESIVPGKTKKGGWSQARYARIREGLLNDFLKNVGEIASAEFKDMKNLKGVIVGGPGPIKENFAEADHLNYDIKKRVLGIVSTSYTGETGLREAVQKSEDIIAEAAAIKEAKLLERYFTDLAKSTGFSAYGEEKSLSLLRQGIVDILIITEQYMKDNEDSIEDIFKEAENMGSSVEVVSHHSPRGSQLQALGGMGAILRYKA